MRIPPPLVYLGAVAAGYLVGRYVYPLVIELPRAVRLGSCALAVVIGVGLMAAAVGLFRRTGQDPKPWQPTPEIISGGIYRLTRNPMYVGMALIQLGIGLWLANAWVVALVPVALAVVYSTAVRHEEAYLEAEFGDTYLEYKNSVRRWI